MEGVTKLIFVTVVETFSEYGVLSHSVITIVTHCESGIIFIHVYL